MAIGQGWEEYDVPQEYRKLEKRDVFYISSCRDLVSWQRGAAVRYFLLSILCWFFGSLFPFVLANPLTEKTITKYPGVAFEYLQRSVCCFSFFLPYFFFCAFIAAMWWGLLESGGSNKRVHIADGVCWSLFRATIVSAVILSLIFLMYNAFVNPIGVLLGKYNEPLYPWSILGLAVFAFILGGITCLIYSKLYEDQKRADAVRYMVFWPILCIFGFNLLSGYICEYFLSVKAQEAASLSDKGWLALFFGMLVVITFVYAAKVFRDDRIATVKSDNPKEGTSVFPSTYHMLIALIIIVPCFFFARFDCLIALLLCACFMAFESWGIISVLKGDKRERYEEAYNIALMIILLLAVPVLSAAFTEFQLCSPPGIEAYYTIVSVALIVVSGYYGHYELSSKFLLDDGPDSDALRTVRRRAWKASLLATGITFVLLIVVPFLFTGEISRLRLLQYDSRYFLDALAAIIGAGSLLSLTVSVDQIKKTDLEKNGKEGDESSSSKKGAVVGITTLFTNLRYAIQARMELYRKLETYGSKRFHQTFSEAMAGCIAVSYFLAKVFQEAAGFFAMFAFTIFIAMIAAILVVFYLQDKMRKKQAGDVRDKA